MTRRMALLAAVALLGIAVSAGLAWAASQLASQRVGLSSEPLAVAAGLAPRTGPRNAGVGDPDQRRNEGHPSRRQDVERAGTPPTPAPATAPPSAASAPSKPSRPPRTQPRDDSGGGSGDSGQGPDD